MWLVCYLIDLSVFYQFYLILSELCYSVELMWLMTKDDLCGLHWLMTCVVCIDSDDLCGLHWLRWLVWSALTQMTGVVCIDSDDLCGLHWLRWLVWSTLTQMTCVVCIDSGDLCGLHWLRWLVWSALTQVTCVVCIDSGDLCGLHWLRWLVWSALTQVTLFLQSEYRKRGFQEVISPNIYNSKLWERSGHWQHYSVSILGTEATLNGDEICFTMFAIFLFFVYFFLIFRIICSVLMLKKRNMHWNQWTARDTGKHCQSGHFHLLLNVMSFVEHTCMV
jgi:hypothetical protein